MTVHRLTNWQLVGGDAVKKHLTRWKRRKKFNSFCIDRRDIIKVLKMKCKLNKHPKTTKKFNIDILKHP